MTTYYVGPMGNDNNSGRTWNTRLLTLNGAEDKPVAPGDVVYVAPGVYRESLTIDVAGTAANPIVYIADVTGENTDGVGGPVRVTGSNNDQTATRASCIVGTTTDDYRTFRGFHFDTVTTSIVTVTDVDGWIIEDCSFQNDDICIIISSTSTACTIRRCMFNGGINFGGVIEFVHTSEVDDAGHVIENCLFYIRRSAKGVEVNRIGGITVRNCLLYGGQDGVEVQVTPNVGQTVNVNNCIIVYCNNGVDGAVLGDLVENYNAFYGNDTDRSTVNIGANSVSYPPLLEMPLLNAGFGQISGFRLPWWTGSLSRWSQVAQRTGTGEPDEDMYGIRRPYTHGGPAAASCSWGPVQWFDSRRSDIRAFDGSLSMRQAEKSAAWMFVPGVSATSHTITVRNWRTAGYGGHRNPEMIIKQSGQADRRTVAGGAAGAWQQLSDTFTPAADPPWLLVEMRNNCDFTTTTTVSTTSTSTLSTTSTTTQTVSTLTTTTTTLACDVWWDSLQVA